MSRRVTPRSSLSPDAAALVRKAFEPRYGRDLADEEVGEIADNLRRFHEVLASYELEDKARALLAPATGDHAASPRSPDEA